MKWRILFVVALVGGSVQAELVPAQVTALEKAVVKSDAAAVEKLLGTDMDQAARILQEVERAQGQVGKYAQLAQAVATKREASVQVSDTKGRQLMAQGAAMVGVGVVKGFVDFFYKTDNASQEGETAGTLATDVTVDAAIAGWGGYTFWCGWNRKEPGIKLSDAQKISALMGGLRSGGAEGLAAASVAADDDGDADDDSDGDAAAATRSRRGRGKRGG